MSPVTEMEKESPLLLRRRVDADLARIVRWVSDAQSVALFAGPSLHWPLTEEQLRAVDLVEGRTAWVLADASAPDRAIGHADLTQTGARASIGRVIVEPERRGRHLGRELMLLMLDQARRQGVASVSLIVIEGNTAALRTYEGLGFAYDPATGYPGRLSMTIELGTP